MADPRGRVLVIAGSDSGGGAGVQADIKTITALGGYAATAITAITVQNTLGVQAVHPFPPDLMEAQARAVLDDIGADAIKIGMLGSAAMVERVAFLLDGAAGVPSVIDPVMLATSGDSLLEGAGVGALIALLVPRARLLTPNAPEAAALTGLLVESADDQRRAGEALLKLGAEAVLMKGGHLAGEELVDLLLTRDGERAFTHLRVDTRHTHGTGCTLASACAAGLALGFGLEEAVGQAIDYTHEAIRRAPGLGRGAGPLDHGWTFRRPSRSAPGEA